MTRKRFTFSDFIKECEIQENTVSLQYKSGVQSLGVKVFVPESIRQQYPYNASAYDFLQFFRKEIYEYGIIEFPDLPVNRSNYTVAMKAPEEHGYSANPYLYEQCQSPHQDTPPYPTAFWLGKERQLSATWIMTELAVEYFQKQQHRFPELSIEDIHRRVVPETLKQGSAILRNYTPGLILIDNSQHHRLYHAKTCRFQNRRQLAEISHDSPMYSFNEVGLLHYIDSLDEQRGADDRNAEERNLVQQFMLSADC